MNRMKDLRVILFIAKILQYKIKVFSPVNHVSMHYLSLFSELENELILVAAPTTIKWE